MKPAPAVPEEAERHMAYGTAAFKGAKSVADYTEAVKEFEQATLAAPWYGDAYYNLGVAQDKAENYEASLHSLKLALLASPDGKEIKTLIYEVEYRKEKESSPEAQAAKRKQQEQEARRAEEEMMRGLEGVIYIQYDRTEEWNQSHFIRIRGGKAEIVDRQVDGRTYLCNDSDTPRPEPISTDRVCYTSTPFMGRITEGRFHGVGSYSTSSLRFEISKDGLELILTNNFLSKYKTVERYKRQ